MIRQVLFFQLFQIARKITAYSLICHAHISKAIVDIGPDWLSKENQIPFFLGQDADKEIVKGICFLVLDWTFFQLVIIVSLGYQRICIGHDQTTVGATVNEAGSLSVLSQK